jgi:DNA-binding NarL/FixJ family response regulator
MENPPLRILLADDHPAVRQGLSLLLARHGMEVRAEEESAGAALRRLAALEVDLALVDLSFEDEEGFRLIAALRARMVPVIVYSMHADRGHVERSLACGANGYVSKREDSSILLQGIDEVKQGRLYLSPRIAKTMEEQAAEETALSRCSERENQILHLLAQGLGNSGIADTLNLSVRTVETYCTRISEKLGLSGMKDLRQFVIREFRAPDEP